MTHRLMKIAFVIFLVLFAHIFTPVIFILQLRNIPSHDLISWILSLYIAASYFAVIACIGAWGWFSKAVRYTVGVLLLVVAVTSYPPSHPEITYASWAAVEPLISIGVGTVFTALWILALLGRKLNKPALELTFPLYGGTYIVAQGGSSSLINIHAHSVSQRYGLDILKLNAFGTRARGLYPKDLNQYAIFGAEILSPCAGVVAAAADGYRDLLPPERDAEHRAGNYIALETGNATIYLAHLMNGSICVKPGERIRTGQVLGRVGNSGNTTEPHLHIHAEEGSYPGQFSGRKGIPIRFNGKFLVRNDCIRVPGKE